MTTRILNTLRILFSLLILGALGWIAYLLVAFIAQRLTSLKSDLAVAIIAASASVTVSVVSLLISKRIETRASIIQELRAKKTPIYEEFIGTLYRVLFAEQLGEPAMPQADLMRFFANDTEKLTIWGSDGVIKAWRAARMSAIAKVEGANMVFLYENLILRDTKRPRT